MLRRQSSGPHTCGDLLAPTGSCRKSCRITAVHKPSQEHHFTVVGVAADVAFVLERHERAVETLAFEISQNDYISARASVGHD